MTLASAIAIAIGIGLRSRQLLADRGLSLDEAYLALNIMHRSFVGLFRQLDFQQAAPDGFLVVQKLVVSGLGSSEYALRLFPFVAACLALVFMLFLARDVVSPIVASLAVALFALSEPLIYYAASNKQYAVDVFVAVVLLWMGIRLSNRPERSSTLVMYAGSGAAAIWVSHPSVFVLSGVSTTLVASSLVRKDWPRALAVSAASVPWLASFGVFMLTSLRKLGSFQDVLEGSDVLGLGPLTSDPLSPGALSTSLGALRYAAGVPHFLEYGSGDAGQLVALLAAGLCVAGLYSLIVKHPEQAVLLAAPLGFMLIAWGLDKYPLLGRTQLFLVPSYVLVLAEGTTYAITKPRRAWMRAAGAAFAAVLLLTLTGSAMVRAAHPARTSGDLKPVLDHLAREQRPGDTLFVHYTAQYAFRYYLECGCAGPSFEKARKSGLWPLRPGPGGPELYSPALRSVAPQLVVGQEQGGSHLPYLPDLDSLRGRERVWVLLSNVPEESARTFLLRELDSRGTRLMSVSGGKDANAAALYLYDFSRSTS